MEDKVIIVGLNPSNYPTKENHRANHTFDRLNRWIDELDLGVVSFTNCIYFPGEYRVKDVDFKFLDEQLEGYNKVLALGGFVSSVLDKIAIPHYKLPHPSPRNRLFNDKNFENKMLEECRKWLYGEGRSYTNGPRH